MHLKCLGHFRNKPWPEDQHENIKDTYDEDFLIDRFGLNKGRDEHAFFSRYFISMMCSYLNDPGVQKVLRATGLKPIFDIDDTDPHKIVICRFLIPLSRKLKHLCVSFLTDTLYTDCMELYSHGFMYDGVHFTFISKMMAK